jgi:hypothetical protein
MADPEHVERLTEQGVDAWNAWRRKNPHIRPDLSDANLIKVYLDRRYPFGWEPSRENLLGAAYLSRADLSGADLSEANLSGANLREAHLREADLSRATLIDTDLTDANLTGCRIFGISAWRLKLEGAKQDDLVITDYREPEITVDNIEVAQFIYLMLHNEKIRDVIDTITSKAVLILGRFTKERKPVLEALRQELRQRNYLPILFDFEKPRNRDTDETITLLARMARFVVADISDAKSVLQELRAIVPDLPSVAGETNYPRDAGGARNVRLLPEPPVVPERPPLHQSGPIDC